MGVVYLAYHLGLQREVAVKLIKTSRDGAAFLERFRIEATVLGRLKHPNIVDVTDYGIDPRGNGIPYLVMERLTGATLEATLRSGPMTFTEALPVLSAVADAFDFAHANGILHRDIKPANVFLSRTDSARLVVKVLDFGVAHINASVSNGNREGVVSPQVSTTSRAIAHRDPGAALHEETTRLESFGDGHAVPRASMALTTPGEIIGTLPYLAPELLAGDTVSPASDLYAFGVLAYEVLAGQRPNTIKDPRSAGYETPRDAHTVYAAVAPEISRVLAWALSRFALDRPRSGGEFVAALRQAHYLSAVQTFKRIEMPRRRRLSAAVAFILCAAAWQAHGAAWSGALESRLIDARLSIAPARPPDPRILVLMIDDTSVLQQPQLLGESADEFAERFDQIFAAGAKGIAIDLLLPQRWSESQQFSRLVLTHADHLALAAVSGPGGQITGPECVAGLTAAALGPERASALFGFVNVDTDSDGLTRRARLSFIDTAGARRDSFAARAIRAAFGAAALSAASPHRWRNDVPDTFLIDGRVDTDRLDTLSWSLVPAELQKSSSIFRDRLVLVGASFVGSGDLHRLSRQRLVTGVTLQAVVVDTILNGQPLREFGMAAWLPVLFALLWQVGAHGVNQVRYGGVAVIFAAVVIWSGASLAAFVSAGWTVPLVLPLLTIVIGGLTAAVMRSFLRPYPRPETV